MTEPSPTIIDGRYRVLERVGTGGMADVFCAEDLQLGRKVAVKVLHRRFAEDASFLERFRQEASSAAGLSHPNVVAIYDRGSWDGTLYIAMEYLEGPTLKELVAREGPLPPARAIAFTEQILKAARFAHSRSIIHRDLKPQNVIVGPDDRIKVTDFGIAKAGSAEITETGSMMGTAQYVAPEQAEGRTVAASADLYAVGVILYELLTGRVPFDGDNPIAIALKHMQEAPVPPSQLQPAVSPALDAVVLHALAKEPEHRFQTADAFLAALGAATEQPAAIPVPPARPAAPMAPVTAAEPVVARPRASRWWWAVVAGLLVIGGLALYLFLGTKEKIAVPRVVGVPQAEAQLQLKRAGFATDSQTKDSLTAEVGTVIGQDPPGGSTAEKGSTITLTISSGPGTAQLPVLTGKPRSEARKQLHDLGFKITETQQASDTVGVHRVIETRPAAGQEVDRGTTVTLVLSSGKPQVSVPKVTGQTLDDATAELKSAGFTVTVRRKEDATADPGTVLSQVPGPGALAIQGSAVTLTVAKAPAQVAVPDVVGSTQADATTALRAAGFKVTTTDQPVQDPTDDGMVVAQDPSDKAPKGATIMITIGRLSATTTTTTTPAAN
jgi:beta-lactam-binding protein with PASTA domain